MNEDPSFESDYDLPWFERQLTVTGQETGTYSSGDLWSSSINFTSEKSAGSLIYQFARPWHLAPLSSNQLTWRSIHRQDECATPDGHGAWIVEKTLRAPDGQLLLWTVESSVTTPGGGVLVSPEGAPELSITWEDCGAAATDTAGQRVTAVQLKVSSGTDEVVVSAGQRASLRFGDRSYVVAVSSVVVPGNDSCGAAVFMVYLDGVVTDGA